MCIRGAHTLLRLLPFCDDYPPICGFEDWRFCLFVRSLGVGIERFGARVPTLFVFSAVRDQTGVFDFLVPARVMVVSLWG